MKKLLYIVIAVFVSIMCFSCTSTATPKKEDPNFIGDFNPMELGIIMSTQSGAFGSTKPREMTVYFIPRKNTVELYFGDFINKVAVILTYENRQSIRDGISMYMEKYEQKMLPEHTPNKKNAFTTGKTFLSWGVTGVARDARPNFYTNYKYLETNRAYFQIHFDISEDIESDSVFSPVVDLYFSPAQLEPFFALLDQDALFEMVNEKTEQFDRFE